MVVGQDNNRRDYAKSFVSRIWNYSSNYAKCYSIFWDHEKYKVFCLSNQTLDDLIEEVVGFAIQLGENVDIYYRVFPLYERPKGRGDASYTQVGKVLFADLDYKKEIDNIVKKECKEGEDYSLECYYQSGNRVYKVDREPLSKVLEKLKKYNLLPSIAVDSGTGYHLYWILNTERDAKEVETVEKKLVKFLKEIGLPADERASDLARVLRLPGTINQKSKRVVKVIYQDEREYDLEEIKRIFPEEKEKKYTSNNFKRLSDLQLDKIKELVKVGYKRGNRQDLALFLSGWFAKAKIDPLQTAKLIKALHDETNDEDKLSMRCSSIIYSYRKAGLDISSFVKGLEDICGSLSGKEKEHVGGVKGKNGVQEILEEVLDKEKALAVIQEIEEILNVASVGKDAIFEVMDEQRKIYAVADPIRKVIARATRNGNGIEFKERVINGYPSVVTIYENPIGGITKFLVTWDAPTRSKPISIGPATAEEIVDRLRAEGLVRYRNLAYDVLSTVLDGYIRKNKVIRKAEIEAPGFYLVDSKIVPNRIEVRKPSEKELKEALELLNELAELWFSHIKDKFAVIIKWGIISPFSFIYKVKGTWMKWLYLYGASATGKTTLAEIVLSIWGLKSENMKGGANIDSVPRLGYVLSQSTFPIVINEPGSAIYRDDVVEVMKSAIESTVVRGKYIHGSYTEIPSLAPLLFTSNKTLPKDDALLRRLLVLHFSYGERIEQEKAKEFENKVKPRLTKLKAIGNYISFIILNELQPADWEDTATSLLELAYKEAKLEVPQWIYGKYQTEDDVYDDMKERIREFLYRKLIDMYTTKIGKITNEDSIDTIARQVLSKGLLEWASFVVRDGYNEVRFKQGFVDELKNVVGDITLKSLAELLGWEYKNVKESEIVDEKKKVLKAIVVRFNDLIQFLED